MKFNKTLLAVAVGFASFGAQAGGFMVGKDINVTGDMSAGAYYVQNNGGLGAEAMEVTDFGLAFDSGETKTGEVGFKGVIGLRNGRTIVDTDPEGSFGFGFGFDFGYMTYVPVDNLSLDVGYILTTIGNEASPSIFSSNIYRGFMWNSQPSAYEGARASYAAGPVTVSFEINHNQPKAPGKPLDWAVAASGSAGPVSYAVTYYDGKDSQNIFDVVLNSEVAGVGVGINLDYFMKDEKPAGKKDDSAMGVGLYVTPKFGKFSVPLRIEYVDGGDTDFYSVQKSRVDDDSIVANSHAGDVGVGSATSFTITPTMHVTDNMFVRAEIAFVTADNKVYSDEDAKETDSQMMGAFQMGYTF